MRIIFQLLLSVYLLGTMLLLVWLLAIALTNEKLNIKAVYTVLLWPFMLITQKGRIALKQALEG